MNIHSIKSLNEGLMQWTEAAILLPRTLVIYVWGMGRAARSYITKRYPPPGRSLGLIDPKGQAVRRKKLVYWLKASRRREQ
jgi:hypothetical protein